jgi:hypothetical protein
MTIHLWPGNGSRQWRFVSDAVMGGVSTGDMAEQTVDGRAAVRMQGRVSTDNNGGFVQIALDLSPDGETIDASDCSGVAIDVRGNGQHYGVHLRSADVTRPQQSYRQSFVASPTWQTIVVPFAHFAPHRIETPLDVTRLRRIGLVAIGREFDVDLAVARLAFY